MTSIARTNLVVPVNFPLISKRALEKSPELSKKINVFGKVLRDTLFYPLNRLQGKERKMRPFVNNCKMKKTIIAVFGQVKD